MFLKLLKKQKVLLELRVLKLLRNLRKLLDKCIKKRTTIGAHFKFLQLWYVLPLTLEKLSCRSPLEFPCFIFPWWKGSLSIKNSMAFLPFWNSVLEDFEVFWNDRKRLDPYLDQSPWDLYGLYKGNTLGQKRASQTYPLQEFSMNKFAISQVKFRTLSFLVHLIKSFFDLKGENPQQNWPRLQLSLFDGDFSLDKINKFIYCTVYVEQIFWLGTCTFLIGVRIPERPNFL